MTKLVESPHDWVFCKHLMKDSPSTNHAAQTSITALPKLFFWPYQLETKPFASFSPDLLYPVRRNRRLPWTQFRRLYSVGVFLSADRALPPKPSRFV